MASSTPDSSATGSRRPGDVATTSRDAFRTLSLSSLGLEMGIAVILGLLLGRYLDGRFGTAPWLLIVGTALGMAAGFKGVYRAMRESDRIADEREREAQRTGGAP